MIPAARARVEVAGRLVGEHDRRPPEQRPRDRDALALAARELRRHVPEPVLEPDPLERLARQRRAARPRRRPCRAGRWRRCRASLMPSSRKNCWKTKPIRCARSAGQLALAQRRDVLAAPPARAARRPLERAHDVQQRRLAGAGRADDRDQLARAHGERDAAEDVDRARVRLAHAGQLEDGGHRAVTTVWPSSQLALDLDVARRRRGPARRRRTGCRPPSDDLDGEAAALAREQRLHRHGEHACAALDARSRRRPAPGRGRRRAPPCRAA